MHARFPPSRFNSILEAVRGGWGFGLCCVVLVVSKRGGDTHQRQQDCGDEDGRGSDRLAGDSTP